MYISIHVVLAGVFSQMPVCRKEIGEWGAWCWDLIDLCMYICSNVTLLICMLTSSLRDIDRCASITVTLWPLWCDRWWLHYFKNLTSLRIKICTYEFSANYKLKSPFPQDIHMLVATLLQLSMRPGKSRNSLISARPEDRLQNISISESLRIPSRSLGSWSLLKDVVELCAVSVRTVLYIHAVRRVGRLSNFFGPVSSVRRIEN